MEANTFVALTGKHLARASLNSDGDWSVEFLLADRDLRCLAADRLNPNVLYAGTQAEGVLRSNDGERSWQPAGLAGRSVKALAVSRAAPGTVYAGTKPPLMFVSRDGGVHWQELESFRRARAFWWFSPSDGSRYTPYVQGIALSPTDPNIVLAGIELGAVLRSADGGKTWAGHRPGALRDCHSLVAHATNGNWMYEGGGTGAGAAFSRDGGQTWRQPRAGLDRHYGWAVAADPAHPEVWYVSLSPGPMKAHHDGSAEAYIFRSAGGAPWQKLALSEAEGGLPQPLNDMAYALITDPAAPGHLYAGLSNGDVWHSTNYGDTWKQMPFNLKGIHRTLIRL